MTLKIDRHGPNERAIGFCLGHENGHWIFAVSLWALFIEAARR